MSAVCSFCPFVFTYLLLFPDEDVFLGFKLTAAGPLSLTCSVEFLFSSFSVTSSLTAFSWLSSTISLGRLHLEYSDRLFRSLTSPLASSWSLLLILMASQSCLTRQEVKLRTILTSNLGFSSPLSQFGQCFVIWLFSRPFSYSFRCPPPRAPSPLTPTIRSLSVKLPHRCCTQPCSPCPPSRAACPCPLSAYKQCSLTRIRPISAEIAASHQKCHMWDTHPQAAHSDPDPRDCSWWGAAGW